VAAANAPAPATHTEVVREEPGALTFFHAAAASDNVRSAPASAQAGKPAGPLLTAGVFHFEEGNYATAETLLRSSLQTGLATSTQRARAHKYLAFIYCVTERRTQCRQEFVQALRADPQFSLTAAEAGHPTWGPVFRAVKTSR
jgi:hypothetical protein